MKTKTKLFIAKVFLKILLFLGFKKKFIIKRNDIKWNLNISEGIDLSIFLFGSFQKDLTLSILDLIKRQKKIFSFFNIIDVGSNIGDKSLSLTKLLLNNEINNFKIFSIEPTEYAFNKQNENISDYDVSNWTNLFSTFNINIAGLVNNEIQNKLKTKEKNI